MNLESTASINETADVAQQRICREPHLTFQRTRCEYDGGRLFLGGQVTSFYEKQLAQGSDYRNARRRSSGERNRVVG